MSQPVFKSLSKMAPSKSFRVKFERVPPEIWCGIWFVIFLALKTVESQIQEHLSLEGRILLQALGYVSVAFLSVSLYKTARQKKTGVGQSSPPLWEEASGALPDAKEKHVNIPEGHPAAERADKRQVLAEAIKNPLENVMAYARFYQAASESDSQHARDLAELMEQAIRIQEILERLDSTPGRIQCESGQKEAPDTREMFRRNPRVQELIPLIVRGEDPLGEEFQTPSYTLNTSPRGACLLLPDRIVRPGQRIRLENHNYSAEAEVRWVLQGKAGSMVFAGVQFGISSLSVKIIGRSA